MNACVRLFSCQEYLESDQWSLNGKFKCYIDFLHCFYIYLVLLTYNTWCCYGYTALEITISVEAMSR